MRFPERAEHQVFLEPEGLDVPEIYVNGMSTSMPEEVQLEFVRSVRGLESAEMLRPGYAVEYDFVLPHQLRATLEVKGVRGLFLAGQICGTSGYEEAAAQGLVAGVNAAHLLLGREAFALRRDQAYIGVLVDDLVTREHLEPYRMFTSAAEHRLLLRADNADERLAEIGHRLGLLSRDQVDRVRAKYAAIAAEERRLARLWVSMPPEAATGAIGVARAGASSRPGAPSRADDASPRVPSRAAAVTAGDGASPASRAAPGHVAHAARGEGHRARPLSVRALDLLSRPGSTYRGLAVMGVATRLPDPWGECLEVRVRYRGYIERQRRAASQAAALEHLILPAALWAENLNGLSREAREKLSRRQPETIGQAARIAGVSPADVSILAVHARRFTAAAR
jgi:tRNA uridine 5-carboxymethylaminomethyl modification enzyme